MLTPTSFNPTKNSCESTFLFPSYESSALKTRPRLLIVLAPRAARASFTFCSARNIFKIRLN